MSAGGMMLVFDILVSVRTHKPDGSALDGAAVAQNAATFHARAREVMQLLDVLGARYRATTDDQNSMVFEFSDSSVRMHPILHNAKELNSNISHNLTTYLAHAIKPAGHEEDATHWLQVLASLRFNPN